MNSVLSFFNSLGRRLGAGWWCTFRDKALAVTESAYHKIMEGLVPELQAELLAAEKPMLDAFKAQIAANGNVEDAAKAALAAGEAFVAANANQAEADALAIALKSIVTAIEEGAVS